MPAPETWISVDIETSGPTPHTGSLISLGACLVRDPDVGFEVLVKPEPGLPWHEDAAAIHQLDRGMLLREGLEPADAMRAFDAWLDATVPAGHRPVMVALNAAFDWMFLADALWAHLGRNPLGTGALDIKALYLGRHMPGVAAWAETSRVRMLERYPVALPHTHHALDDAREQALLARGILEAAGLQ